MKFFNTAGPVNQDDHYKINPLERWDMEEILMLIDQRKYFLLHAPRQTGKTSCLLALRDYLNAEEKYNAVYCNLEAGQAARGDVAVALPAMVRSLMRACELPLNNFEDKESWFHSILKNSQPTEMLHEFLAEYCQRTEKPLILFLDEVDALVGDTLISLLRQIRSGYDKRPQAFPQSLILCGVRDIHDYRIHTKEQEIITGGSAFNIKSKSLTLGNFSEEEIRKLYQEHTTETGQTFEGECFALINCYTAGQPWLVNALAYEVTSEIKQNRDRSVTITAKMMEEAKERLVLSRATHLAQLADKLEEDRVRNVVLPIILGEELRVQKDDVEYCADLGLIRKGPRGWIISNEIYREIIPRELTQYRQETFLNAFSPEWVREDGSIDGTHLCKLFQQFWRENSDIWASHIAGYQEAAPHLVFQAFLQRVANGTGIISREYALARKRVDLMLKWRYAGGEQRIVIELKVIKEKDNVERIKSDGLVQTAEYAEISDATESHLILFDRADKTDWQETIYQETVKQGKYDIKIWGM